MTNRFIVYKNSTPFSSDCLMNSLNWLYFNFGDFLCKQKHTNLTTYIRNGVRSTRIHLVFCGCNECGNEQANQQFRLTDRLMLINKFWWMESSLAENHFRCKVQQRWWQICFFLYLRPEDSIKLRVQINDLIKIIWNLKGYE